MNKLLNEILSLSQKLILKWNTEGVSVKEGEGAVLEVIKEYMNPQNPNVGDMQECIVGLNELLNK